MHVWEHCRVCGQDSNQRLTWPTLDTNQPLVMICERTSKHWYPVYNKVTPELAVELIEMMEVYLVKLREVLPCVRTIPHPVA